MKDCKLMVVLRPGETIAFDTPFRNQLRGSRDRSGNWYLMTPNKPAEMDRGLTAISNSNGGLWYSYLTP